MKGVAVVEDSEPALFIYQHQFLVPGEACHATRVGIMGVLQRSEARVFTHEETCPDRVSACMHGIHAHADLGSLWLWCNDTQGQLGPLLQPTGHATIDVADRQGCTHRLWRITESDHIRRLQQALSSQPLYLADGHHRYAAGWNFATIQTRTSDLRMRPGCPPLPDLDTLETNARRGVLLPPKTTDFWPKLAAGLVLYRP